LRTAGCFRLAVPRSHGGLEVDLFEHLEVMAEVARADGSVGWTVMIGTAAPVVFGLLPRATFDAIYADGPDVIFGGVFNPTGVATPVEGGYTVSGRWAFASGCQHCDWFAAHCFVPDDRMPPVRMMVLPRSDVEILDTWSVSGLRGTGSHDFVVDDVLVPDERTFAMGDAASVDGALWRVPEISLSTMQFANVAIAIAQGALDDVMAIATDKVPAFDEATLASNPLFQNQIGEADAKLRAARTLLYADAGALWSKATSSSPITPEDRARIRGTTTWAIEVATSVVDTAFAAGGGSSIYDASPLQRRLRDIHALGQHFLVKSDTFTKAGAVLLGQEVDLTVL
jgi:alkylation response protein AidB-like acyl-CoA dehydrogenase